ncbi:MAG: beta-galactosidase [Armatimonadetes bacterium]|nr:beta-galactosidase [Candidatus Hippobium faecium]
MKTDFFPYGVQYYRQPTPLPEEWEEDLKNIKASGYTHIQLRPQWKWAERIEGEYNFEDIAQLMDLAQKYDLKVILKPMAECAPDWIFSKYEGSRIGYRGVPIPPIAHGAFYVGGWLPCFDNPKVKEGAYNFARALALKFKDHPALWFYNAWNEPRSRPGGQCQCRHSKESYRNWLRNLFGNVENLNKYFGKAYTSFETIDPPCSATDYVEMMLWRTWAGWAVSQHVKNIYDGIKSADPDKEVMCHVGCCQAINDPLDDATDDMANKNAVDFYGTSFPVPLSPKNGLESAMPLIIGDWMRRVDSNFWVQEFYPCQGEWGKEPKASTLKRTLWLSIATGCQGWTFWQYRSERVGNESNGWGMREINGKETVRSKVCDEVGAKLAQFSDIFANTKKQKSQVAQIFHKEQDLMSRLEEWKQNFIDDDQVGVPYMYKKQLQNFHTAFTVHMLNGIDFITWKDDLTQYKAVAVVGDEIITPNMASKMKEYVKGGGNLIVEFPFACRDMTTWVSTERPNNGLEELLGIKEKARYKEKHSAAYKTTILKDVPVYIEAENIDNAEVIGHWDNGVPCGFKHKYGKGTVYTFLASPSYIDNSTAPYLAESIYREIGLSNILPYGLLVLVRKSEEHSIIFMFNFDENTQNLNFNVSAFPIIDKHKAMSDGEKTIIQKGGYIIFHS